MITDQNLIYCITGAAGFVGSVLTRRLVEQGKKVHVLVKPSTNLWRIQDILNQVELHYEDLSSVKKTKKLLKKIKPDVIYHLAVRGAYSDQNDPQDIFSTDFLGTWNLLQATQDIDYKLFINTGSSSEYGTKTQPMSESDRLDPNSYYAIAKAAATHLAQYTAMVQHKPIVTVRLFSVYGPYEQPNRLLPNLMKALFHQTSLKLTNPHTARDFVYIDDVIEFYLQTDNLAANAGQVFNLGTGVQTNLAQLVAMAEEVTGQQVVADWGSLPDKEWDTTVWVANMQKASKLLQWSPRYSLKQGLAAHWDWFKSHFDLYD